MSRTESLYDRHMIVTFFGFQVKRFSICRKDNDFSLLNRMIWGLGKICMCNQMVTSEIIFLISRVHHLVTF